MMDFVREGDILFITKLDRLARSVIDLQNITKFLEDKNVIYKEHEKGKSVAEIKK